MTYRYMRYLTLRKRISSTTTGHYSRLAEVEVPTGKLNERLEEEKRKKFQKWLQELLETYKNKNNITLDSIEQFIEKCHELHGKLENIEKHSSMHINQVVKDIGLHISQTTMFKITEMPFSIKKVVENMNSNGKVS